MNQNESSRHASGAPRFVNQRHLLLLLLSAVVVACSSATTGSGGGAPQNSQPAAAAQGESLHAKPADRLKVLFLGDNGPHQPTPRAKSLNPVLAQRGVDLYYTDTAASLDPEVLKNYHAVVLYNNQPNITPAQLSALRGFVRDGGGLVAIHAASAAFQNSPEYVALIGASFQRAGTDTVSVNRVEPMHPIFEGVPAFRSFDETLVHTNHNTSGRTVLATRTEGAAQEPWTWVRNEGNGRVFYTASGHDAATWTNPGFQSLIERAIKWSVGDWALTRVRGIQVAGTMELTNPLPNYLPPQPQPPQPQPPAAGGAPGGRGGGPRMGEPFRTAQVALSMDESIKLMTVPVGFHVEPYASETLIYRPIDINWDERGRTWVVETIDYPEVILEDTVPGHDRILILEDTNGDGKADRNIVFADKLNLASSMMFINGGVVVSVARRMIFLKDTNGDDRADVREVLNSGWRINDTHGMMSNLRYGVDNMIWASVGYNGFNGTIDGRTLTQQDYAAGAYRFRRDGTGLDYVTRTSNNTWGLGFTEDNFVFMSTANNRPTQFIAVPGAYYRAMGLTTPPVIPGIADRNDMFSTRPIMQVDQFGNYTAGSGHEIYTARAFPREFWNRAAFVTEPTGHVVGWFDLQSAGSGFTAKNRWNLMASQDAWAAPVQAKVGPDGAVWVTDFYSLVAQHNPTPQGYTTQPGAAYATPYRSKDHGRIYRIVADNAPTPTITRLDNATPAQLVAALRNDNMFWRLTAQRLLVDRGQTDVVPALIQLVDDRSVDDLGLNPGALHAVWTLDGLGAVQSDPSAQAAVRRALTHPAPSLRRAALAVLPRDAQLSTAILGPNGLGQDADLHVRLAAALVVSEYPASAQSAAYVNSLLGNVANLRDPWMPDAIAIIGAKQGPQFLLDLLQRPVAADSLATVGLAKAVNMLTRVYALRGPAETATIVAAIERVPQLVGPLKVAVLTGVLMGNTGWPANQPPTLTAAQQASLKAAARGASEADMTRFNAIGTRWGMPTLFAQ